MRFSAIAAGIVLPLLAVADSSSPATVTLTGTSTYTQTVTVSRVVASVYSTISANSTSAGPTAPIRASSGLPPKHTSTAVSVLSVPSNPSPTAAAAPVPTHNAAAGLNSMYAGSAGLVMMVAAALL